MKTWPTTFTVLRHSCKSSARWPVRSTTDWRSAFRLRLLRCRPSRLSLTWSKLLPRRIFTWDKVSTWLIEESKATLDGNSVNFAKSSVRESFCAIWGKRRATMNCFLNPLEERIKLDFSSLKLAAIMDGTQDTFIKLDKKNEAKMNDLTLPLRRTRSRKSLSLTSASLWTTNLLSARHIVVCANSNSWRPMVHRRSDCKKPLWYPNPEWAFCLSLRSLVKE